MSEFIGVIKDVGFPIFVAVYLLIYMRKTLNGVKDVITKNTEALTKVCDKLNIKD